MEFAFGKRLAESILVASVALGILGAASAQEITVINSSNTVIPDGSTVPSEMLQTHFGHIPVSDNSTSVFYQIINLADTDLEFNAPVTITGAHAGDFTVDTQPVGPVDFAVSLQINFDPPGAGLRTATVTINSNDSDEGIYTFNISGTGGGLPLASPDLRVNFAGEPKIKYNSKKDTLKVSGKLEIENLGPVQMDSGIVQVYYSADTYLGPEDDLMQTIPLKNIKAYNPEKLKKKKAKFKMLLNSIYSGHVFVRVLSQEPMTEDLYWIDNTQGSSTFAIAI